MTTLNILKILELFFSYRFALLLWLKRIFVQLKFFSPTFNFIYVGTYSFFFIFEFYDKHIY